MNLTWKSDSKKISIHAHFNLDINDKKIVLRKINTNNRYVSWLEDQI